MTVVSKIEQLKKLQGEENSSGFSFAPVEDKDMTKDGSIFNKVKASDSTLTKTTTAGSSSKNKGIFAKAKELIGGISSGKSGAYSAQGTVKSAVADMNSSVNTAEAASTQLQQFSGTAFKTIQSNNKLIDSLASENENVTSEIEYLNAEIENKTASQGNNPYKAPQSKDEVTLLTVTPDGGFDFSADSSADPEVAEMQSRVDGLNLKFNSNSSKIKSYAKSNSSAINTLKGKTSSLIAKAKLATAKAQVAEQKSQAAQEVGSYTSLTGGACASVGMIVLSLPDPTFISKPWAGKLLVGGTILSVAGTTTSTLANNSMSDTEKATAIGSNVLSSTMQVVTTTKALKTPTPKVG